jgi:hypothetical protein
MATIRLSGYDPDVFYKFKQHLIDKVCFPDADGKMQLDISKNNLSFTPSCAGLGCHQYANYNRT